MKNTAKYKLTFFLMALSGVTAAGLSGREILGKPVEITKTDHVDFAPGGLIQIKGSYGTLNVEAWDKAEVEVVVTKSLPLRFGDSKTPDQDQNRLEGVQVKLERISSSEVAITTTPGSRDVIADYEIHVPRDSRLKIQHGVGFVQVRGVKGDIDASAKRGDILLWLPPAAYSIDARTKLGVVSSEFDGRPSMRAPLGEQFTQAAISSSTTASAHSLHLRMGFGGITIEKMLPN